jgi:N-methylhydantoinase A
MIERSAEMRYGEQIFEIDVSLSDIDLGSSSLIVEVEERFHRRHKELYTYASPDQEVVFVNARVAAVGAVSGPQQEKRSVPLASRCTPVGSRQAFFGEWREVPIYAFSSLRPGHFLEGPAIIEAETTTVVVDRGDHITVNSLGWLDIRLRSADIQ